jgi:hypothetical protein
MVAGFSPTGAEIADFYGAGRRIEGAGRVRFSDAAPVAVSENAHWRGRPRRTRGVSRDAFAASVGLKHFPTRGV